MNVYDVSYRERNAASDSEKGPVMAVAGINGSRSKRNTCVQNFRARTVVESAYNVALLKLNADTDSSMCCVQAKIDEWYIAYQDSPKLQQLIARAIPDKEACVVQVGCGNSRLAPGLVDDGWRNLVNVDISRAALQQMQRRYARSHPDMGFLLADATHLKDWSDGCIDAVVDKGTLQSLMLLQDGIVRCQKFASEMHRVLRPGGVMIQILGRPGMQIYLKTPEIRWAKVVHSEVPRDGIGGSAHIYVFHKAGTEVSEFAER
jgi:SAM-dependent methyltransferase